MHPLLMFFHSHLEDDIEVELLPQVPHCKPVEIASPVVNAIVELIKGSVPLSHFGDDSTQAGVEDVIVALVDVCIFADQGVKL